MHAVPFMRLTAHLAVFHIQLRARLQVSILSHLRIPVFPVHSRRTLQHKTFLWKCVVICSEEPAGWPVFQFAKQPLICYNHCGLRYEELCHSERSEESFQGVDYNNAFNDHHKHEQETHI